MKLRVELDEKKFECEISEEFTKCMAPLPEPTNAAAVSEFCRLKRERKKLYDLIPALIVQSVREIIEGNDPM